MFAVLPSDPLLDTEAEAAQRLGLSVLRFRYLDSVEIVSKTRAGAPSSSSTSSASPHSIGIYRGFMLTQNRYAKLYSQLLCHHKIKLVTDPTQYAAAHYYPNLFANQTLAALAPRSRWVHVTEDVDSDADDSDEKAAVRKSVIKSLGVDAFLPVALEISRDWAVSSVSSAPSSQANAPSGFAVLKDYVKSAKPHFLRVPIADPVKLAESCLDLVHHRASSFNRGVVIKEYHELRRPRNEWRLWFCNGECVVEDFNGPDGDDDRIASVALAAQSGSKHKVRQAGMTPVPQEIIDRVTESLKRDKRGVLPYITVDFAQTQANSWILLEIGDGGVSGPAVCTCLDVLWKQLRDAFAYRQPIAAAASSCRYVVDIHSKVEETWQILRQLRG